MSSPANPHAALSAAPAPRALARARRRAWARGFTLSELMIATITGLLVSLAAFVLSRGASKFFQDEARITTAQLSASLGLQRLAGDIQRAGFLSSPNVQRDPARCGDVTNWPPMLQQLQSVRVRLDAAIGAHPTTQLNGLSPDELLLGGSYHTVEQFPVRAVQAGGAGGLTLLLQTQSGAMYRTLTATGTGGTANEKLSAIFTVGRALRIVDQNGRNEYGFITGIQVQGDPPTNVAISLDPGVPIPQMVPGAVCGYSGFGTGMMVNPVSIVRYRLTSLVGHPRFGALVAPVSPTESGDDTRLELVREELDRNMQPLADSLELVSEFAVDLKFGFSVVNGPGNNPTTLLRFPIPAVGTQGGLTDPTIPNQGPERIRQVQVRLVTRTRSPDREENIVGTLSDGRRYRYRIDLPGNPPRVRWARTRTLYADVSLPNQAGVTW